MGPHLFWFNEWCSKIKVWKSTALMTFHRTVSNAGRVAPRVASPSQLKSDWLLGLQHRGRFDWAVPAAQGKPPPKRLQCSMNSSYFRGAHLRPHTQPCGYKSLYIANSSIARAKQISAPIQCSMNSPYYRLRYTPMFFTLSTSVALCVNIIVYRKPCNRNVFYCTNKYQGRSKNSVQDRCENISMLQYEHCAANTSSTSQFTFGFMANEPCWWWMQHQRQLLANIFAKLFHLGTFQHVKVVDFCPDRCATHV